MRRLTMRAVPGTPAADSCFRDRAATAGARLARAPVDPELLLHRASRAVRRRVVAEGRPLAVDAGTERRPDRAVEPGDLVGSQSRSRAQRAEPGAPERLVRVDVPEPCDDALVEEHGFERGSPCGETGREPRGRETGTERLGPVLRSEVRLELVAGED